MGKPHLMHFRTVDSRAATLPPCDRIREIKSKCEQSLVALQHGNHTQALQIMRETLSKYDNSSLAHRVQGTVHAKLAALTEDPVEKQKHIEAAIYLAQWATKLAPSSIEFAHFYASLLFDNMGESEGYELALVECERALLVESPVDPAEESLHVNEETVASTPQARIHKVKEELKSLLHKYRPIPVRYFTEPTEYCVPTEPATSPPHRNNE